MGMNLLMICIASFAAVFVVLIFLALIMGLITRVFPEKRKAAAEAPAASDDAAVYAAIASTYMARFPGTRVSRIEGLTIVSAPPAASDDAAVYAAIASTYMARFPGTGVTHIKEL
ncbi:MAG: hypothetical protein C4530_09130 [Desulfobacteraceae bacterium]|nr:MAG: hypothetical protein C4530_09130 [Desulfobacteraceae bacterium]